MKTRCMALAVILMASFTCASAHAENEGADLRILHAKQIFNQINASNKPIPKEVLAASNVIIIFPSLAKGGFLYAGRFGLGIVMVRNPETHQWSAPAFTRMSGGSFGFQAGAQFTELILVGKANYKFDKFNGGPAIGTSLSATAGWWGVHSEFGNGWESPTNMHWFSRNQGLFGSISAEGTVMSYDQGATSAYYGKGVIAQDVLFGNAVNASPTGQMLLEDISKYDGSTGGSLMSMIPNMPSITFSAPPENEQRRQIQVPSWMPRFGKK